MIGSSIYDGNVNVAVALADAGGILNVFVRKSGLFAADSSALLSFDAPCLAVGLINDLNQRRNLT